MGLLDRLLGKPMGKPAFAAAVAKAIEDRGVAVIAIREDSFSIELAANDIANLDNVYAQYLSASQSDRKRIIENYVLASSERVSIPSEYDRARPHLMPIMRASTYSSLTGLQLQLLELRTQSELEGLRGVQRELVDDLMVALAYDSDVNILQINQKQMAEWGVSFEHGLSDAVDNLRLRTNVSEVKEEAPGVYAGRWNDSYESARLVFPDLIYRLEIGPEPVCFVPTRNEFWITDRSNSEAIKSLLRQSEEKHFGPYSLHDTPLLLVDRKWKPFFGDDDESKRLIRNMRLRRIATDYSQQTELLTELYKREQKDIFVANCMLWEHKETKEYGTRCIWSKGIPTMLPMAKQVSLFVEEDPAGTVTVSWDVLYSVVGNLMKEVPDLLPKRYFVDSFPTNDQMAELKRNA